jgi:hypothetical protein
MLEDNEDIKSLLQENLTLTRDVHRTMRSIRRYIAWGRIVDTVKFLFVVGALAGAYFFIQPYLAEVMGFYQGLFSGQNQPDGDGMGQENKSSPLDFEQLLRRLENTQ